MISKGDKFFDTFDTPHNHCAMVHHCKNSIGVIVQGQVKNLKVQVWKKYVLLTAKNQNPAYFHFFRIIVLDGSIHI